MNKIFVYVSLLLLLLQPFSSLSSQVRNSSGQMPMYMLTYDHGGLILWGGDHFRERLQNAASWLDKYPGFKIGLDNEAHMYDYIAIHQKDLLSEIQSMLDRYPGRFGIGSCTYGQPLSQFVNEESNIRQIAYAMRANTNYFNYTPDVYVMSEHGMHAQMPQILKGFGFKGAIMRTHFMMYGYNPTYNAAIGWWIGMDGSRIPTIPTYEGEGAEFFKTTVDNWVLTRYPSEDAQVSLQGYRELFPDINPLLASRFDDSGLRKEALVKEYDGNPLFNWILLDELLALYPEPEAEFKTQPDDFTVRMPWGYCGNKIWNTSRKAEVQVLTAERIAAFEFLFGNKNREETLRESWKNLLVAQHHDVQIVGLTNEADSYLAASLNASESVLEQSLAWAAGHMSSEGIQQVTVFNPLSWERSEWIETKVSFEKGQAREVIVTQGEEKIPVSYLNAYHFSDGSIYEATIAFNAKLPPLSLCSFSVLPVGESSEVIQQSISLDEVNSILSTPYYSVQFNTLGGISSMKDLRTGKQVFDPDRRNAFFSGVIEGREMESEGRWIITKPEVNAPWITATEYGFIADIPFTFEMKFYSNSPRIDCRVDFQFDGQKIGQLSENKRDRESPFIHDKKLRFKCFPSLSDNATGIKDLPFMLTETSNTTIEGNYWTALGDEHQGLAYFNKGTMGSVHEDDGGFSIPLSYAMYYIWGTRMLKGNYSYEFALMPFHTHWKDANLHKEAIAYNFPAIYSSGEAGDGSLGNRLEIISSDSENILLSAFYVENEKLIARFYESSGASTAAELRLKNDDKQLIPVDLRLIPLGPREEIARFRPWEVKSYELLPNVKIIR
ncbi:hypothetical protein ACFLT1_02110 [Bacteroidota bacterium]